MTKATASEARLQEATRANNPIFGPNTLKLGIFGYNQGCIAATTAPERYIAEWPGSLELVRRADALGLEAMVSRMGWRGTTSGRQEDVENISFEPFTWCAGLAAASTHPALVATFHAQLVHPAFIAKATATVDHISAGRFAINMVAGFDAHTFSIFGRALEDANTRYDHLEEYVTLLKTFWLAEDEFDFEGRFYQVKGGTSFPKPVQQPLPPIMNAGQSGRGRAFAAKHADMVFTHFKEDLSGAKAQMDAYRQLAHQDFGREIQMWTHGFLVVRDTEREARDYLNHYAVQHADEPRIRTWIQALSEGMGPLRPEQLAAMSRDWGAGGGLPLVGTPDTVTERLIALSQAGLDGILFTGMEPLDMLVRVERDLLPRLEQAGLRQRFRAKRRP